MPECWALPNNIPMISMLPGPIDLILRQLEPRVIQGLRMRRKLSRMHRTFSSMTVEQTFHTIYAGNDWGGVRGQFSSGPGSEDRFTEPYCRLIRAFITDHHVATLVNLGCGDFRVGRQICTPSLRYVGVDVVSSLIDHLKSTFGSESIVFEHQNILEQFPPDGDLCLIRQVLQHLSNTEIGQFLHNVQKYAYVIVTEHVPACPEQFNLDKPHGPDVRLHKRSGVFLDQPPFSLKVEELLTIPLGPGEVLRTVLLRSHL